MVALRRADRIDAAHDCAWGMWGVRVEPCLVSFLAGGFTYTLNIAKDCPCIFLRGWMTNEIVL